MTNTVTNNTIAALLYLLFSSPVFAKTNCVNSLEPYSAHDIQNIDLTSQFKTAILDQDTNKVRALLLNGADPNKKIGDIETPLFHAVWSKNIGLVKTLLQSDEIDVNATTNWIRDKKTTALMLASEKGLLKIASSLIEHPKIKLNFQNHKGHTALMIAIIKRNVSVVEFLINIKGINLLIRDNEDRDTLQIALNLNHTTSNDIIKIILDSKAYNRLSPQYRNKYDNILNKKKFY